MNTLEKEYKFKIVGIGPLKYHLEKMMGIMSKEYSVWYERNIIVDWRIVNATKHRRKREKVVNDRVAIPIVILFLL